MTMMWDGDCIVAKMKYPKFRVRRYSDSRFWGFMKRTLLKWADATTVGYTVYFDDRYYGTDRGAEILWHEEVHIKQWHRWKILMPLSYLLLLPTVLTFRAYWEWQAYKKDLRDVRRSYKFQPEVQDHYCQWVASQFSGWNYFFMFPFKGYMYRKAKRYMDSLPR